MDCDVCVPLTRAVPTFETGWMRVGPEPEPTPKPRRPRKRRTGTRWQKKRARIYERDGYRCVRCGATTNLTLDHRIPRSKGGSDADDNLQTMCAPCNHEKGDS